MKMWPESVPHDPLGFQLVSPFREPYITEIEDGPDISRRSSTKNIAAIQFSIRMTATQFGAFKAWARSEIVDGSLPFTMKVWTGEGCADRVCRFKRPYQMTEGGTRRIVSLTLDVRGLVMPATVSDALAEAYASAPANEFVIRGVELIHPRFQDGEGNPDSLRAALDEREWTLPHEATARMHPGQSVLYEPLALRAVMPAQDEGGFGELRLSLDNVPRTFLPQIEAAAEVRASAILVYREWVAVQDTETGEFTLPAEPDLIVGELTVKRITTRMLTIECSATFIDLLRKGFPTAVFDRDAFPGLFG